MVRSTNVIFLFSRERSEQNARLPDDGLWGKRARARSGPVDWKERAKKKGVRGMGRGIN